MLFSSVAQSYPTLCDPWTAARQASLSITNSRSPPKPMSIESVMPSNHLILCHPLLLLSSIFPSIRVFSNESALRIRWPKYWSFSFNISPSNEHTGLISFRMHWLDLLAVQGTLKSLLQHHSSKASILQCSVFFIVQFSHPYMTPGKNIPNHLIFFRHLCVCVFYHVTIPRVSLLLLMKLLPVGGTCQLIFPCWAWGQYSFCCCCYSLETPERIHSARLLPMLVIVMLKIFTN